MVASQLLTASALALPFPDVNVDKLGNDTKLRDIGVI
jgi:hypothetical protein